MVRIDSESLWGFRPSLTDYLEGSAPSQGLDRGFFDRPVHALDLAIGPGVIGLGQTMFDAVLVADAIKNVSPEPIGRAVAIPWLLSERHTVVSEDSVDFVWKRLHYLT